MGMKEKESEESELVAVPANNPKAWSERSCDFVCLIALSVLFLARSTLDALSTATIRPDVVQDSEQGQKQPPPLLCQCG